LWNCGEGRERQRLDILSHSLGGVFFVQPHVSYVSERTDGAGSGEFWVFLFLSDSQKGAPGFYGLFMKRLSELGVLGDFVIIFYVLE